MTSLLLLGFLIGMRHAMEADHVAAVASLSRDVISWRQAAQQGAAWGLGHTLTLFLFGSVVLWMDAVMPETLAHWLELLVGVMLVVLGIDVLRRIVHDRIHFHRHRHGNRIHLHAHSHASDQLPHSASLHRHEHTQGFPLRFLLVGIMHGMAGSAALILLTLKTIHSPWLGMLYMLLFGFGSVAGMALLSVVIAIPMRSSARRLTWMHNSLQFILGLFTLGLGVSVVWRMGLAGAA